MTEGNDLRDAVVIERSFDAPVDVIWQMWTDPEHFSAWYGPVGASIQVATMDVRAGGIRLISMKVETPDGPTQMWFTGEYREVVERARLVYTEFLSDEKGKVDPANPGGHPVMTEVRVEFEDLGGSTRVVLTHAGIPSDSPGAAGWTMALDELATHLGRAPGRHRVS